MNEYKRNHVPAFGSWNYSPEYSFSRCFESAGKTGLFNEHDLYVTGDLYENNIFTPAMIVVPRRQRVNTSYRRLKEVKKNALAMGGPCECGIKEPPSAAVAPLPCPPPRRAPKAIDEDLYEIPPELLHAKPKMKRAWRLFSSCLLINYVC